MKLERLYGAMVFVATMCSIQETSAQSSTKNRKWETVLEVSAMPSYGYRMIGKVTPDINGGFSETGLKDSFSQADKLLSTINAFATIQKRGKKFNGTTYGLGLVTSGFDRVKTGNMFGYEVIPDVVYDNQVVAGEMEVHYEFRSTYLVGLYAWDWRIDGISLNIPQGSLWIQVGAMPALMLKHGVKVHTVGFEIPEGNDIWMKDYIRTTAANRVVDKTEAQTPFGNIYFTVSSKLEYEVAKDLHAAITPRIMQPILPDAKGVQQYWSPVFGLQVGLLFSLGD